MNIRIASIDDSKLLAEMNAQLIRDEGHRNSMTPAKLENRVMSWLARSEYEAVIFEDGDATTGYALFRRCDDHVYLRQFFVAPEFRRRGVGASALAWLWSKPWRDTPRIRIDVLVGNDVAAKFWQSVGFEPYCTTMEMQSPSRLS